MKHRLFLTRLVGITLLLACPAPALAQDPAATPSKEELRKMIREIIRDEMRKMSAEESAAPVAPATNPKARPVVVSPAAPLTSLPVTSPAPAVVSAEALDDKIAEAVEEAIDQKSSKGPWELSFGGYGDIQAAHYDYKENAFSQHEGSRGQSRTTFDLQRFTLEIEAEHKPAGLEFEAEIEFEHGGTGSSLELEADEFGEFEQETEKGGEVIVEELYVKKDFTDGFSARVGRFYVGVGLLSDFHKPTEYLTVERPEVETIVLPGVWDEIGAEGRYDAPWGNVRLQLVNGLDSTGFGSSEWVASGHQGKFETTRAQDVAGVLRVDTLPLPGVLMGASAYLGGTSNNRPQDDLDVDGTLFLGDLHARVTNSPLLLQGSFVWGHLSNSAEISDRNSRISNNLGVDRTPIGSEALGVWAELGYDVAPLLGVDEKHAVHPFIHGEYYDTMYDTDGPIFDNERFERTVGTAGVVYTFDQVLNLKLDYSVRDFGGVASEKQGVTRLGVGFVY